MQHRKLGRTGIETGCMGFGGIPLVGLNEEEASRVLNRALDLGVNFIDTARGYKESEELIGRTISSRRDEFCLATKTRGRDESRILFEFKTSLENLRTETVDLYQIHYVNTDEELEEVLREDGALSVIRKFQKEGRVRWTGITGHDSGVLLKAAKTGEFDTIQGAFSYIERPPAAVELVHYCAENEIGFIVQKPLAGGALLPATAALKWILQYPVSVVIPGMLSVEQVEENVRAAEGGFDLTQKEREDLETVISRLSDKFCRRCYYCQPVCPQKIRIGVVLEFLGKAQIQENRALARRWYAGMKVKASDCTECGLCLPECPYDLPIIDMLKEAHELLG
jgi:predicted aldo/keto reductase-like oxidoreductase